MKFRLILIPIIILFIVSCSTNNNKVIIRGKAYDGKAGAIVDNKKAIYYLDSLHSWPKEYLNKKVIVSGQLIIVEDSPISDSINKIYSQSAGTKKIIVKPKYRRRIF